MAESTPTIPAWAARYRDRCTLELAEVELYDPWPIMPAPTDAIDRWGRTLTGRTYLGTAIYLIGTLAGAAAGVGVQGVDPTRHAPQPGLLLLALPGGGAIPVIRFRYLSTEE